MANLLQKDEIDLTWKKIARKAQRATIDDEVAGPPNYLMADPNFIPLGVDQETGAYTSLGSLSANAISNLLDASSKDKIERFNRYKRLSSSHEHPEVEGILNIYADEATNEDQDGNIFLVRHPDKQVQTVVNDMIERVGLYDKVWEIAWNTCGYGEDFYEVIPSQNMKRILKINWVPRDQIERVEMNGILQGFRAINPKEAEKNIEQSYHYTVNKSEHEESNGMIYPFRVLHFRIPSKKYGIYGKSIIDTIIGPIEQLKMMERAMTIARVVRAPERRVYTIDVGNLSGEKAIKYAYDAVNYQKKKKALTNFTNNMMGLGSERPDITNNVFGTTEDIIIPKRQGSEGNSITTLDSQQNAGDVGDLEFIRDKIFPPVGIPRQYLFDDSFANANVNLSSKSLPFARRIRRVQRFILRQVYKLAVIELKLQGYANSVIDDLLIMMNNPSTIYEEKQIEIETSKWNLIAAIKQNNADGKVFYPDYLVYKNILKLNDDEIVELLKLGQLQTAGQNPFNIMDIEERPEGAEDLSNAPSPMSASAAVGAPGAADMGGDAGAPPPIPDAVSQAMGTPPASGGDSGGDAGEDSAPAPSADNKKPENADFYDTTLKNPVFEEALARKNSFIKTMERKKQHTQPELIAESAQMQTIEIAKETINYSDKDDNMNKPTGIVVCLEELALDGEFDQIDKWIKKSKKSIKKRDTMYL